jgi:hypothetical protein
VTLNPPVFVTADEPLLIFETAERAREYVEWMDVEDGIYQGYDSDGRRVDFDVETVERKFLRIATYRQTNVVLRVVDEEPRHADELARVLREVLADEPGVADLSLPELQALAVSRRGFT